MKNNQVARDTEESKWINLCENINKEYPDVVIELWDETSICLLYTSSLLDATMMGMGRGAGNCAMELLLSFLKNPKYNVFPVPVSYTHLDVYKRQKLRREQRCLSRKYENLKKGESTQKHIQKQKLKVKILHHKIDNIRTDYINKSIAEIVKTKPSYITIENLNVSGMKMCIRDRLLSGHGAPDAAAFLWQALFCNLPSKKKGLPG